MWLAILAVVVGLAILVWSADVFIDGAVALANKLNVPSFLIGVIILGLGTSAPEMIVSMLAALEGSPELALGNAYGSNIVNIALVLGATVLISPIIIRKSIINRDMPLLLLVTAVAAWQLSLWRTNVDDHGLVPQSIHYFPHLYLLHTRLHHRHFLIHRYLVLYAAPGCGTSSLHGDQ